MVFCFNTRNVSEMTEETKEDIVNHGVPLEVYTTGIAWLGAKNRKAVEKAANMATLISYYKLPIPPSRFIEFIVGQTTGTSKRDYRIMIDGKPGDGKSYVSFGTGARYGIESAAYAKWCYDHDDEKGVNTDWIMGTKPRNYFSLDNCALLQDSEGVTNLMDHTEKRQCVIIDDAGVAASSQSWQSPEVKALGAIMQTCRTKRWFLIYNAPNRKMVSNQVRELVYAKGFIYKPCHDAQMNLIKINSTEVDTSDPKNKEWKNRFSFDDKKIDFYAVYHPDLLGPYKGMIDKYDALRDAAGDSLIHVKAVEQHELKNPTTKTEKKFQDLVNQHYPFVKAEIEKLGNMNALNRSAIRRATGLSDRNVVDMMTLYRKEKGL
jgi:hypothetical protein